MEKLRWGVIGAGGIADTRTIPGILEARNAELVALTARTPGTCRTVAPEAWGKTCLYVGGRTAARSGG